MRISDWSSDVCSSDLPAAWRPATRKAVPAHCETLERQRDWPHERPQGGRTGNSWAAARWRTWKGRALDCFAFVVVVLRSEERRVGKGGVSKVRCRWWPYH